MGTLKKKKNKPDSQKYLTVKQIADFYTEYKTITKQNPFKVKDWVGKDALIVEREREKPLTMEGLRVFCYQKGFIVKHYFDNRDGRYSQYVPICSFISEDIRLDQITGGMAGMYNPSITQRLNNLVEKSEVDTKITETKQVFKIGGVEIEL